MVAVGVVHEKREFLAYQRRLFHSMAIFFSFTLQEFRFILRKATSRMVAVSIPDEVIGFFN
jgi:hypothetical protein